MADLEMLLVKLDINSPRPALHRGTPDHSTKRTRLQLSATSFFVIREDRRGKGRTPQKYTPNLVLRVASRPGRYCPFSIDWAKELKICSNGGRPYIVLDRSNVRGLQISMSIHVKRT